MDLAMAPIVFALVTLLGMDPPVVSISLLPEGILEIRTLQNIWHSNPEVDIFVSLLAWP